jgi:hypothetical protein
LAVRDLAIDDDSGANFLLIVRDTVDHRECYLAIGDREAMVEPAPVPDL